MRFVEWDSCDDHCTLAKMVKPSLMIALNVVCAMETKEQGKDIIGQKFQTASPGKSQLGDGFGPSANCRPDQWHILDRLMLQSLEDKKPKAMKMSDWRIADLVGDTRLT
uniref:Uncharacterized protein n=1 Tax=Solanum tuberosum TaxID=4113 RepID=M1DNB8_SOLTU